MVSSRAKPPGVVLTPFVVTPSLNGMRRLPLLLFAILLLLVPATRAVSAPIVPPFDLYELGPLDAATNATAARDLTGWLILHQEVQGARTWYLLALPDGTPVREVSGTGRPGYLGRVREGERVVFLSSGERALREEGKGRSIHLTPSGSTVLVTPETPDRLARLAPHSFRVIERTQPPAASRPRTERDRFRKIVERTLAPRAADPRTAEEVIAIRDRLRADSLETIIRTLAEFPSGDKRSRYFARPETETVSRLYIASKLEAALGAGSVTSQSFAVTTADTSAMVTNVVGALRCGLPNAGAILVTAHYDAIGLRSDAVQLCNEGYHQPGSGCDCSQSASAIRANDACDWDWRNDPAPGANDNGSGIACLLEAARVLPGVPFEFDILFVAFQGEELGLLGSAAYADSIVGEDQEILAVFNMDQIGYNSSRNQMDLVANESSEWFADYIESTALLFTPDLAVNKHVLFFTRSDHASFWSVGIDAILLNEDIDVLYPQYHTFQDTWANTFPSSGRPNSKLQLELGGKLLIATLARLAVHYDAPDLALPAGELEALPASGSALRTGSPVRLVARVHNLGASHLTFLDTTIDTLSARVEFFDGDPDAGGVPLGGFDRRAVYRAGGVSEFSIFWTPTVGDEGFHELFAVVTGLDPGYEIEEVSRSNNVEKLSVFVEAPENSGPRLLTQYPFPNPVRGSVVDLRFYYELTQNATVTIQVFDLEATLVGEFVASALFFGEGNRSGPNRVNGASFDWKSPSGLESGVYFYTIQVGSAAGEATDEAKGKFALVR